MVNVDHDLVAADPVHQGGSVPTEVEDLPANELGEQEPGGDARGAEMGGLRDGSTPGNSVSGPVGSGGADLASRKTAMATLRRWGCGTRVRIRR